MIFSFVPAWELPDSARSRIARFLDTQSTAHPFQYLEWSPLGSALRTRSSCCWLEEGMEIRAFARANVIHPATRFLPAHRALVLNRGPVCDNPELLARLLEQLVPTARELGFVYVDINPEVIATDFDRVAHSLLSNRWTPQGMPRASLRLDLTPDPDALLGRFRKTTRHEIRRAEQAGVAIELARDDHDFEMFYGLLAAMSGEKGFSVESRADLRHVWQWITSEPARGVLLLGMHAGELQGGVMIVRAARRAWYVWGATRKDLPFSVGHLLQWHAIQWAKGAGCVEYDFGGYTMDAIAGPACFKHGFCDRVVKFPPLHRRVLNDPRYEHCISWTRWRKGERASPAGMPGERP
jgi:lipid II:glycine glycyltransferase (peptidoglycan interpeptide bridge formation enzyme)